MASSILGVASADAPAERAGVARRLARQRGAMVGAAILAVLAMMAVGAAGLAARDPIRTAPRMRLGWRRMPTGRCYTQR